MEFGKTIAVRENKTVYRDGNRTIKVFAENYPKSFIMNEAHNQAIIEEAGMNVPAILEIKQADGKWMVVSEYFEGEPLDVLMKANPEKIDEYLDMFVDLQVEFHKVQSTALTKLKDRINRQIKQSELEATTRFDFYTKLGNMPKHHKICHGDFNPSNVIVGKDGKAYILDWSHATQGNASGDAAMTYLLFRLDGENELAEKYLKLFCEKSGNDIEYVKRWIPIVAAAHSVESKGENKKRLLDLAENYGKD
ncbi:MAG: aminoglycoside phosphotransferase family protein [Faecalibacterium sp.]|nr:aminoglycoside phosphotransferase family protein [Ruminococcus sp.]MCM1391251.1 aminoglycoside phosphotransferase family protein [Ruminococcus sp.]MCM1484775.1 aminoglycoside phosphotransferase family protein [Faecalibacterium sp.]